MSSPSTSVKIQIMGGKVCLSCKCKTLLSLVNKATFENKKFVDINQQCFALLTQVNFPAKNMNFHWRYPGYFFKFWWIWPFPMRNQIPKFRIPELNEFVSMFQGIWICNSAPLCLAFGKFYWIWPYPMRVHRAHRVHPMLLWCTRVWPGPPCQDPLIWPPRWEDLQCGQVIYQGVLPTGRVRLDLWYKDQNNPFDTSLSTHQLELLG